LDRDHVHLQASIVVPAPNTHGSSQGLIEPCLNVIHARLGYLVYNSDLRNGTPWTCLVHEKLCLLATLAIHVINIVGPVALIHHLPVHFIKSAEIVEPIGERGNSVAVGKDVLTVSRDDGLGCADEIDQWSLPLVVANNTVRLKLQ